jgi:hypothetical protein
MHGLGAVRDLGDSAALGRNPEGPSCRTGPVPCVLGCGSSMGHGCAVVGMASRGGPPRGVSSWALPLTRLPPTIGFAAMPKKCPNYWGSLGPLGAPNFPSKVCQTRAKKGAQLTSLGKLLAPTLGTCRRLKLRHLHRTTDSKKGPFRGNPPKKKQITQDQTTELQGP